MDIISIIAYGLLLIFVSVFLYISKADRAIIFPVLAFDLRIIFQHCRSERLVFIDKELPDLVFPFLPQNSCEKSTLKGNKKARALKKDYLERTKGDKNG